MTSVTCLLDIKAILPKPTLPLTALGYHLAKMPVDVRIGKMLITASLLQCLEPALTVAGALAGKSPFSSPPNSREEAFKAHSTFTSSYNLSVVASQYSINIPMPQSKQGTNKYDDTPPNYVFFSDHLATVNAYNLWEMILEKNGLEAAYRFCRDKYLSHSSLDEIRKLRQNFRQYLREAGFVPQEKDSSNNNDDNDDNESDDGNDILDLKYEKDEKNEKNRSVITSSLSSIDLSTPSASSSSSSSSSSTQVNSSDEAKYGMLRCALCAGLFPQVVRVSRFQDKNKKTSDGRKGKETLKRDQPPPLRIMQGDGVEVFIHPNSLTHKFVKYLLEGGQGRKIGRSKDAYIVYHKKIASSKVFLHDCTSVPAAAVLLFGGDILISRTRKGGSSDEGVMVTIGSWIHFKMNELHAVLYRRLQWEIEALLRIKVEDPNNDVTKRQAILVKVIETLIE